MEQHLNPHIPTQAMGFGGPAPAICPFSPVPVLHLTFSPQSHRAAFQFPKGEKLFLASKSSYMLFPLPGMPLPGSFHFGSDVTSPERALSGCRT